MKVKVVLVFIEFMIILIPDTILFIIKFPELSRSVHFILWRRIPGFISLISRKLFWKHSFGTIESPYLRLGLFIFHFYELRRFFSYLLCRSTNLHWNFHKILNFMFREINFLMFSLFWLHYKYDYQLSLRIIKSNLNNLDFVPENTEDYPNFLTRNMFKLSEIG